MSKNGLKRKLCVFLPIKSKEDTFIQVSDFPSM